MNSNFILGKLGELLAKRYYEKKGFKLLHSNYRIKHYEIDLVFLSNDKKIVFVEVKTRSDFFYSKNEILSNKKLLALKNAIYLYLQSFTSNEFTSWELELFTVFNSSSYKKYFAMPILQGFG